MEDTQRRLVLVDSDACSRVPAGAGGDYCPPPDPSQSLPWGAAAAETLDMPPLVPPRRVQHAIRTCPFTPVERSYGKALINAFIAGAVPTRTGTLLHDFLANQLSRDLASIASQFTFMSDGLTFMSGALSGDDVSVNLRMQYVPAPEASLSAHSITRAKEDTALCFSAFEEQLSQEHRSDALSACSSAALPVQAQDRVETTFPTSARVDAVDANMRAESSMGGHCPKAAAAVVAGWVGGNSTASQGAEKGQDKDWESTNEVQCDGMHRTDEAQPANALHSQQQVVSQSGSPVTTEQARVSPHVPVTCGTAKPACPEKVAQTVQQVAVPTVSFDDDRGGWTLRVIAQGGEQVHGPFQTQAEAYNAIHTCSIQPLSCAVPGAHAPPQSCGEQHEHSDPAGTCQPPSAVDNGSAGIIADSSVALHESHDQTRRTTRSGTALSQASQASSDAAQARSEVVTEPNRRSSRKKRHPELLDPCFVPRKLRNLQQWDREEQEQGDLTKELEDEEDEGDEDDVEDEDDEDDEAEQDEERSFRGVTHKSQNCWAARISHKGTEYILGTFKEPRAAAEAYDDAARRLRGSDTLVNFPNRPQPRPQPKSQNQRRRREKAKAALPKPYTPPQEVCNVSAIYKGLYLGSANAACDLEWLRCTGIKHVLNVTKEGQVKSHFQNLEGEFEYQRLSVEDVMEAKIDAVWDKAFQFLDKVAASDEKVLVHCRAGRSRSVSIVVAWAMKSRGCTLARAWQAVSQARENARPNMGFMMQLMQLERQLHQREDNSHDFFDRRKRGRRPNYYRDEDYS